MSQTTLTVNGRSVVVDVERDCPLLYVLRDTLEMNNPRFGCGLGQCGACTVLVDDRPVRSCLLPVSRAIGRDIVTLEGLSSGNSPHVLQSALIEHQAFQCGYCLNGWTLTAKSLLDRNAQPTDAEIRSALDTLVCRCGSQPRILAAIRQAAGTRSRTA